MTLRLLANLAGERGFPEWRRGALSGNPINSTKSALPGTPLSGPGLLPARGERHTGTDEVIGLEHQNRKEIQRIVNLGTAARISARACSPTRWGRALEVRFAANSTRAIWNARSRARSRRTTLFVVASKTFTTQETMSNAAAAKTWGGKVFYAVTSNVEAARHFGASEILPMWDWVGGALLGVVGGRFAAACAMGFDAFQEFLSGGARDRPPLRASAAREKRAGPDGADRSVEHQLPRRGRRTRAAYSNALRLLPAYLQQLEMNRTASGVDRENRVVDYSTAPVVWDWRYRQPALVSPAAAPGDADVPVDFIDFVP